MPEPPPGGTVCGERSSVWKWDSGKSRKWLWGASREMKGCWVQRVLYGEHLCLPRPCGKWEEVGANSFPPVIGSHRREEGNAGSDALFIAVAISYAQQLLSLICLKLRGLLDTPGCYLPVLTQRRRSTTRTLYHTCRSGLLQTSLPSCTLFSWQFPNAALPSLLCEGFFFLCTANHSLPSVPKALQGRNLLFVFCESALNTPTATQKNV